MRGEQTHGSYDPLLEHRQVAAQVYAIRQGIAMSPRPRWLPPSFPDGPATHTLKAKPLRLSQDPDRNMFVSPERHSPRTSEFSETSSPRFFVFVASVKLAPGGP